MTTPRSPRGRKAKGDKAELRVKRWAQKQEGVAFVLDGRPSEPGCDLLVFYRFPDRGLVLEVLEVKAGDWNRLSSLKRQSAAVAGDLWRSRGVRHAVIDRAAWPKSRIFTVGRVGDRASTLLKPVEIDLGSQGGGIGLGLMEPQYPHAERAGVEPGRSPGPVAAETRAVELGKSREAPASAKRIFSQDAFDALEREVG